MTILAVIKSASICFPNRFIYQVFSNQQHFFIVGAMATLETLNFDNRASRCLPIDPVIENNSRQVKGACYSRVKPTPVDNPKLVAASNSALELLDLSASEIERKEFVDYFSGNAILPGSDPVAHCYCGHQFGYFAGQLGDGAAITLGETVSKSNDRWEIQLKGAGKTPYSRTADGRKVLRSSIREFLCSEAMHFLGIPSTRAGCIVTSDSSVVRDIFYDGNPILEKCSIICRIAPSFIRFGSLQICKGPDRETGNSGPSAAQPDVLKKLIDHVIETYYPDIWKEFIHDKGKMYVEFFGEVVRRTARLVAQWQCVGWCHGVLNTDNMSILGLTIDYGPFGFLDHYDPDHICNASDTGGRYSYKNQPGICKWNCEKLADVLQIFANMTDLQAHLNKFMDEFNTSYITIMRKKFGLTTEQDSDMDLVKAFLETMGKTGADFTNSFRCLSVMPLPGCREWVEEQGSAVDPGHNSERGSLSTSKLKLLEQCVTVEEMKVYYKSTLDPGELIQLMSFMEANPALKVMMGKQEQQITVELKRMERFTDLSALSEEDKKITDSELWNKWLASYVQRLEIDVQEITKKGFENDEAKLKALDALNCQRISIMNSTNPMFVLRNYIAQEAIDAAEKGNFSKVKEVLKRLERPYDDVESSQEQSYKTENNLAKDSDLSIKMNRCQSLERPPRWASEIRVT